MADVGHITGFGQHHQNSYMGWRGNWPPHAQACKEQSLQPFQVGGLFICCAKRLLFARRQIRATAMRHFCRQTDAFASRGMRVDRLANVARVRCDLNRLKSLRLNSQLLAGGEFGRP